MPKYCNCSETHTVHFLSRSEIVVDHQINVSGVPLSDCFTAFLQYWIKGDEEATVDIRYGVKFLKSTVFRSKIEDSGVAQSKRSMAGVWIPKVLQKIDEVQGKPARVSLALPVVVEEKKDGVNWNFWMHFLQIVVILALAFWIRELQIQIDEISVRGNR
jgi:hypothetical protein